MNSFVAALQRFGIGRLAALLGIGAGVAAALIALTMNLGEPKALLYSNLDLKEAGSITTALDQAGVKYEVKGDGSTIMVSRDQVASGSHVEGTTAREAKDLIRVPAWLRVSWRKSHPEGVYELLFLQAEPPAEGAWQLPGEPWTGKLEGCQKLFLLADEPPATIAPALSSALKQLVRAGCVIGGLSAGVYPLAQIGLLDGYRAAVHWRWQDDFAERFPKVIATSHLFDWDRDRLSACGGLSVLDLLLAVLARDHGAELAGAVSEELVVERIREGGERQRIPLQNRLGSSHPKLTQAVLLMEANIEEPLTTDEIAQHVCVSRRQLERIFKQYLTLLTTRLFSARFSPLRV